VSTAKALGVTRIPAFKGQGIPAHDPRVGKPTGVTYATSPMGADHTAGTKYEMEDEGAVEHSLKEQIVMATVDAMGLCYFATTLDRRVMMEFIKDLLNVRYGLSLTADDVVDVGRDTLRDEMKFNAEAGFVDANDPDPEFIRVEPVPPMDMVFGVPAEEMAKIWDNLDTVSIF
ncbi:MAG: aldehyde ferredoxin oxidoreductase C-terminal domain-containing protein, partial [Planctomycetota bacterium]|jgi:aldehyde:ferredoxin oxidoreductase